MVGNCAIHIEVLCRNPRSVPSFVCLAVFHFFPVFPCVFHYEVDHRVAHLHRVVVPSSHAATSSHLIRFAQDVLICHLSIYKRHPTDVSGTMTSRFGQELCDPFKPVSLPFSHLKPRLNVHTSTKRDFRCLCKRNQADRCDQPAIGVQSCEHNTGSFRSLGVISTFSASYNLYSAFRPPKDPPIFEIWMSDRSRRLDYTYDMLGSTEFDQQQ